MKVGDDVGHFRVISRLGRGGMGEVWLAEHPVVRKRVAIKAIPAERAVREVARDRFLAEARAVAGLTHPNIVAMHDFGATADGDLYLIMEYLEGVSLARRLEEVKKLPVARAVAIASQIADALAAAHGRGIIHRDLKPDNIHLVASATGGDIVKVLDFGLAKTMDGSASMLTAEGVAIGTPEYMAPEQVVGKRDLDERVDVYALGCLIYEMVTGRPPFVGEVTHIMRSHRDTPPDLSIVPASLQPVLERALAKDKNKRFSSVTELASALVDLPPSEPVEALPSHSVPTVETPSQPKRRGVVFAAVGAAAAIAIGLSLALGLRKPAPAPPPPSLAKAEKVQRKVAVSSQPPGADVLVDDVSFGTTPVTVPIDGERSAVILELRLAGHTPWRGVIDPARSGAVEAVLAPIAPAAPPAPSAPPAASAGKSSSRPSKPKPNEPRPFDDTGVMAPNF